MGGKPEARVGGGDQGGAVGALWRWRTASIATMPIAVLDGTAEAIRIAY
jgi:hypothetical protein